MTTAMVGRTVGRKKLETSIEPKRAGTMIRVSDEFAEAFRKACALQGASSSEFADLHFLPMVRVIYRDLLDRETREYGGKK